MSDNFLINVFNLRPIIAIEIIVLDPLLVKEIPQLNNADFSIIRSYSFPIRLSSVKFSYDENNDNIPDREESD